MNPNNALLQTLKRQALSQKQLLQRYLAVYEAFQKYVEALVPVIEGKPMDLTIAAAGERFRLLFNEYESKFLEWEEGYEVVNGGIAAFLDQEFEDKEDFRTALLFATVKFEDVLAKAGRDLKELHEQIALEEGQSKAEEITHVPSSALTKIKDADAVAEIGSKWLGRIITFGPWAYNILKNMHLPH